MQAGVQATPLMHLKYKKKYVEDVKSALQADAVIQKTAFSGEISFKVNVTQTSATGHLVT